MGGWAAVVGAGIQSPVNAGGADQFSVVEVVGQRLVELEGGQRVGIGGVETRRLIEQEVPLRRPARGREGRGPVGQVEVQKDGG